MNPKAEGEMPAPERNRARVRSDKQQIKKRGRNMARKTLK